MMDFNRSKSFNPTRWILLLILGVFPTAIQAATFVVNDTSNDFSDANPGDGVALTVDGKTSLRAAIEEANALQGPDEIVAIAGILCELVRILESTLFIEDDLRIYLPEPCHTYRTGGLTQADIGRSVSGDVRAMHVRSGVALTLEHIGMDGGHDKGGGLYMEPGATVHLIGASIRGSARLGGAIYNDHGTLILSNSVFSEPIYDNVQERVRNGLTTLVSGRATEAGSAIYNEGGEVTGSGEIGLFANNFEGSQTGDVIYNDGGTLFIDGAPSLGFRFGRITKGNSLGHGGGIYSRNGVVSLKNLFVAQHTAVGHGGAIYLDGGTLSMEGLYITGSAASGGAVYVASGTVQADRVLVVEATASEAGGGLYLAGGTATLVNTTFSGNTAATTGGGLHIADVASALLLNATFSENTAATGGGLWAGGPGKGDFGVRLGNSLLAGNTAPAGLDVWGEVLSLGHNLVGVTEGSTGFGVPGDLTGTMAAPRDPRLDSIPAMDRFSEATDLLPVYALLEDSPARDAGSTALLMDTALLPETPGYDQRGPGYPRFQGAAVDIGAYEYALPRVVPEHHSADQNNDGRIRLSELLRAVQLYNLAAYHCDATGEDGYAPGPGDALCPPHTSDYNPQDWRITLSELLRLIQFYNSPNYAPCPNGEDGYCLP
jgi:hypothetical protein